MDKIHIRNIGLLLTTGFIMLLIVNPIGNFPLLDDSAYALPVFSLVKNGTFTFESTFAIAIGQILWGTLFCIPFGFSFTTLRISVIILGFTGLIVFYLLVNKFTGNKKLSLLCALLLLVNPIFFLLCNTFMTDVPFLSFTIFAIYFFSKSLDSPKRKNLLPAIAFSIIATLIRQYGVVIPLAYAITQIIKNKPSLARSGKYFLPAISAIAALIIAIVWLKHKVYGMSGYSNSIMLSFLNHPDVFASNILMRSGCTLYFLGVFLFPLLLFSGYNYFKVLSSGQKIKAGIFIVFFIPSLLYGWGKFPIPGIGNLIDGDSIGVKTLRDIFILHLHDINKLPAVTRNLLSIIGLTGAILLLMNMAILILRLLQPAEKNSPTFSFYQAIYLLLFTAGYTFLLCIPEAFFDRYLLPLLPIMTLLIVLLIQKKWEIKRLMFSFSIVYVFLIALFSSLAIHDYLQWNRARLKATDYLTKELSIPPYRVDGGMEYNTWIFETLFPNDKSNKLFWYARYSDWMIAFGEAPHYNVIRKITYTNYLPYEKRNIYILKHNTAPVQDSSPEQRFKVVIQNLEKSVKANQKPEDYFLLGTDYLQAGRFNDCININKKLVAISPNYIIAYNNIAVAYGKLSMWKESAEAERKALSFDSSFTYAKINLNYALSMMNSNNGSPSATNYLTQSVQYFNQHQYEECIAACKKCLELDKSSYVAWNNICSAYNALGKFSEAEKACAQALKIQPSFAPTVKNMEIAKQGEKK